MDVGEEVAWNTRVLHSAHGTSRAFGPIGGPLSSQVIQHIARPSGLHKPCSELVASKGWSMRVIGRVSNSRRRLADWMAPKMPKLH